MGFQLKDLGFLAIFQTLLGWLCTTASQLGADSLATLESCWKQITWPEYEGACTRMGVHTYLPPHCSETSSPRAPEPWSRRPSAWRTQRSPSSSWTPRLPGPCILQFPPKAKTDMEAHYFIPTAFLCSKYHSCLSLHGVDDLRKHHAFENKETCAER